MLDRGRASHTIWGLIQPARQPDRSVAGRERVVAVDQNARRPAKPDSLRFGVSVDHSESHVESPALSDFLKPVGSKLPVRTVREILQLDRVAVGHVIEPTTRPIGAVRMTAISRSLAPMSAELVCVTEPLLKFVVDVAGTVHVDYPRTFQREVVDLDDPRRVESMFEEHANPKSCGPHDAACNDDCPHEYPLRGTAQRSV